jgi:hypothetical protein
VKDAGWVVWMQKEGASKVRRWREGKMDAIEGFTTGEI